MSLGAQQRVCAEAAPLHSGLQSSAYFLVLPIIYSNSQLPRPPFLCGKAESRPQEFSIVLPVPLLPPGSPPLTRYQKSAFSTLHLSTQRNSLARLKAWFLSPLMSGDSPYKVRKGGRADTELWEGDGTIIFHQEIGQPQHGSPTAL